MSQFAQELRRSGKGSGYADAGIAEPRSGRGVSRRHVEAALAGQPLASRFRAKLTSQHGNATPALIAVSAPGEQS